MYILFIKKVELADYYAGHVSNSFHIMAVFTEYRNI